MEMVVGSHGRGKVLVSTVLLWLVMIQGQGLLASKSSSHAHSHSPSSSSKNKHHHPPPPPHPPHQNPSSNTPPLTPSIVHSSAAFSLYYGRNFKVVQNLFFNYTYLLLQQPVDFLGNDQDVNISVFEDPLSNYTLLNNVPVGFLELLGALDKLRGIALFGFSSPCVLQLIAQAAIPFIDVLNSNQTSTFEALFSSLATTTDSSSPANQSNYISFDVLSDQGPLQRAEWIKFLAAFFDLETRANDVYGQIESNYRCLNASVKDNASMPVVAWLTYKEEGVWTFSNDAFNLQLSLDAGGINPDPAILSLNFNMSNQSDVDNFYNISSTLQVVIDETYAADPSTYTLENFTAVANISDTAAFPFLANKRLWRYDKRVGYNGALDWLEGGIPQPQLALRDLMEVLYPTGAYNTTYFRNIGMGESILNTTSLECPHNVTSPLQPTILPCNQSA